MKKEIITTNLAPAPAGNYSQAVKLGNMVYVSGTCPLGLGTNEVLYPGDMGKQTILVLEYIENILKDAGTSLENVVKVTSYLNNLDNFTAYNSAYSTFFTNNPPVRTTVEIVKFLDGMCVEIDCIAYIPNPKN